LGLPLGAVVTTDRIAPTFGPGDHGTTFGGGPLSCRVGFEFLKVMQEEAMLEKIRELGDYFKSKLLSLKDKYPFVKEVRGEGLILGMELSFPCREVVNRCLEAGYIINVTSDNVLRFLPPYVISKKEIAKFIQALDRIFKELDTAQISPSHPSAGGVH
jgi:acetylornithine/succinyldiaminopimelate/putrescine aminotransferase